MTRAAVMAEFFRARPNTWIDGRTLSDVAGCYAWRTRCSDIRRSPFNMNIENRMTVIVNPDGTKFTKSEYRYVPTVELKVEGVGAGQERQRVPVLPFF